jgi:hypothetical protein
MARTHTTKFLFSELVLANCVILVAAMGFNFGEFEFGGPYGKRSVSASY